MPQPIKPRECKMESCRNSRTGKPGRVVIRQNLQGGKVYEYGECDTCLMRYTPAEMLKMRRVSDG